jgi:D-alanyl-D-alanine carboxypeptidase
MNLHNYAYKNFELVNIKQQGTLNKLDNDFYKERVFINRNVIYPLTAEEQQKVKINLSLITPNKKWEDPEDVPDVVGEMSVLLDKKEIAEVPIYFDNGQVEKPKGSVWELFKSLFFAAAGVNKYG